MDVKGDAVTACPMMAHLATVDTTVLLQSPMVVQLLQLAILPMT